MKTKSKVEDLDVIDSLVKTLRKTVEGALSMRDKASLNSVLEETAGYTRAAREAATAPYGCTVDPRQFFPMIAQRDISGSPRHVVVTDAEGNQLPFCTENCLAMYYAAKTGAMLVKHDYETAAELSN